MRTDRPILETSATLQGTPARVAALFGAAVLALAAQTGPVPADELDGQQVARTPDTADERAAKLSQGFDLSFDAKAVIGDSGGDDAGAGQSLNVDDRRDDDSAVTLHGVHKLELSLYPDDQRFGRPRR